MFTALYKYAAVLENKRNGHIVWKVWYLYYVLLILPSHNNWNNNTLSNNSDFLFIVVQSYFVVRFQNMRIDYECIRQLILWSYSPSREQNLKEEELSHAWHWKASLISLPTETWNWEMVLRGEASRSTLNWSYAREKVSKRKPVRPLTQLSGKKTEAYPEQKN